MDDSYALFEEVAPQSWRLEAPMEPASVDKEFDRRLKELGRTAQLPGFRRGHIPRRVLVQRLAPGLREHLLNREAQIMVRRLIAERGMVPALAPEVNVQSDPTRVEATFEVFPEVEPFDFGALAIDRPRVRIDDHDIQRMLERLDPESVTGRAEGVAPLREALRESMEAELKEAIREELADRVEDALLRVLSPLELPSGLVEKVIAQGDLEAHDEATVRQDLLATLAVARAASQLAIRPEPSLLWEETERLAERSDDPQRTLDEIWADPRWLQEIEDDLLRHRVATEVLEVARVTDLPMSFTEFAEIRRGA